MLRFSPRSHRNVIGLILSGRITRDDYINTIVPKFDDIINEYGKACALLYFTDDFSGYEFKAVLEDARYGIKHMKQFEKIAVVNAPHWINVIVKFSAMLTKCHCRIFLKNDENKAWEFIESQASS